MMALTAVLNVGIERVAYRPLRNAPRLAPLISAIGMSFVLQNIGLICSARRSRRSTRTSSRGPTS